MRSAEPASSQGRRSPIAFSTCCEALRVAIPFSSASKLGMPASQPSGRSRFCWASISAARSGFSPAYSASLLAQAARELGATLADSRGEVLADAVGDEELGVLGPAVGTLGLAHLLFAERLAVGGGGVDSCAGSRSRCGCRR